MLPFESEYQIGPPAKQQRQLKQQLRQQMSKRRDALAEKARQELSFLACRHAAQLMEQRGLQRMLVYVPFRSELDSRPLVEWAWGQASRCSCREAFPATGRWSCTCCAAGISSYRELTAFLSRTLLLQSGMRMLPRISCGSRDLLLTGREAGSDTGRVLRPAA